MEKWNDYQNERIARLPYDIKGKTYNAGNNQALYVKKVINTESNGGTAYVTVLSNEKIFHLIK